VRTPVPHGLSMNRPAESHGARKPIARYGGILRLLITVAVFSLILTRVDAASVVGAMQRISAPAIGMSFVALAAAVAVGVFRWRALMTAYGARG
jgi:hypothetical protein